VGDDQAAALLLVWRGAARVGAGEAAGADDLREAYRILDHHAHPKAAASAVNFAEVLLTLGQTEEARATYAEALAWARRIGHQRVERICLAWLADLACHSGRRDEALELLEAGLHSSGKDEFSGALLLLCRARIALLDQPDKATEHAERVLAFGDTTENDEIRLQAHAVLARAHRARGASEAACAACDAFLERWHAVRGLSNAAVPLVEVGLVLAADGRHVDLAAAATLVTTPSPWADATRRLANGSYEEAAAVLDAIPSIPLGDAARELSRATSPSAA
jgi:tetratricopeptide (TPR) repeat protein